MYLRIWSIFNMNRTEIKNEGKRKTNQQSLTSSLMQMQRDMIVFVGIGIIPINKLSNQKKRYTIDKSMEIVWFVKEIDSIPFWIYL